MIASSDTHPRRPVSLPEIQEGLSEALAAPPAERAFISESDLFCALGAALGFRQISGDTVSRLLGIYDGIRRENIAARCASWTLGPPLPIDACTCGGAPLWHNGVGYAEYLAGHSAAKPIEPPPLDRDVFLDRAWAVVCGYAQEAAEEYDLQMHEARKAVGPLFSRGVDRNAALAIVRERAPVLCDRDVALVLDEEAAWWLRWRHDRGFRVEMEAA